MIWWILLIVSAIALLAHWGSRNAVWGTATMGTIIGVVIAIFRPGFDWWIVGKALVIATLIGVAIEWLPRLGKKRPAA
ncbi:hypothetical protein [Lysobacter solisilvae (ex Woo and Kim 2020)]|uniref:GlsB/YeaQ/YmgE family stress response membrane protein n=1 Tax=Agrilutibacter terrestris TaxID=2865112 RepID=A0A7H0FVY6_9GAMM|nr:hypothetical protein [Lysobacter terrestris]QNP40202.1 hypothetical protein H8B22_11995 [Lysobacter terrestris]